DAFAAATDNWTKSAIAAAAAERPAEFLADAFARPSPAGLRELVVAVAPSALPANASAVVAMAAGAGPDAAPLKVAVLRAVAQSPAPRLTLNAAALQGLQKLLADPAT